MKLTFSELIQAKSHLEALIAPYENGSKRVEPKTIDTLRTCLNSVNAEILSIITGKVCYVSGNHFEVFTARDAKVKMEISNENTEPGE